LYHVGDNILERQEAVAVLKEILTDCRELDGNGICLMPPNTNGISSKGLQVHIKDPNKDKQVISRLKAIADRHDVALHENDGYLVIYRPLK
jgi:hypothetical protein